MNFNDPTKTTKNSLSFISLTFGGVALFIGLLFTVFSNNHRQYSAGNIISKEEKGDDNDAIGMAKFFFNARRNPKTNTLDYEGMLAATMADRAMFNARKTHSFSVLPNFNWVSAGPTNIGGRTRAILIDKNDPTHQTIFAGGITGGIWKSIDGGSHWGNTLNSTVSFSQDENMLNMNICCIAQDANGAIYVGTGEGFTGPEPESSSGELGGGIFKSTDDGNTWRLLPSTIPVANNPGVSWAYTNRIAINPNNPMVIYAATGDVGTNTSGLYISHDSGTTWKHCYNSATNKALQNATLDVKISNDGSVVIADVGGYGYICYPNTAADSLFTEIHFSGPGKLPGGASRIEFAISPLDPNRIYASDIASNGSFGGNTVSGIFMTLTAQTNGGYWYDIGPGGSMAFDPYAEPASVQDQATYDNTLGVSTGDGTTLLAGGTVLYEWTSLYLGDTVGSWTESSGYYRPIHPDEHTIVYDTKDPNVIYLGCDGGIYKSSDGAKTWAAYNRNYDVTQYYSICFSPEVNYDTVNYGPGTMVQGLGLGGGTQDNGSPYVNGNGYYKNDANDLSGGDGAGSAVSMLNPNIAYFCSDYGSLLREGNLGSESYPTSAYTKTVGVCRGANIDSIASYSRANYLTDFVFPVALYENYYDTLNHDSVEYITQKAYDKDSIIWVNGANGSFPYKLPKAHPINDTFNVPDRVVSRLACAFDAGHGLWINGQGASNNTVVWMPVAYSSYSKPTSYTGTSIHAISWTPDGDAIYTGDNEGNIFRFTNLNAIVYNDYCSGALWWSEGGFHATGNTTVVSTKLTLNASSNRDILAIAVDPKNGNNILVCLGGYEGTTLHSVYLSANAQTGATPTFTDEQGNLPTMPVYGAILDIDSAGNFFAGSAMLATEHGLYVTSKLSGGTTVWTKTSSGMPANVLTQAIKQQVQPNWMCNNSGDIYVGTHGRGLWMSNDLYQAPNAVPTITKANPLENLLVYPNPMNVTGNIEFMLTNADNVTISIYNIQGKEVKTMNLGNQAPGNHVIPFSVADLQGGTYFVSLTGTDFRKTSKFIVVK